ncbi:tryptophan 2,3-dioxygenase-like [Asterias amurensis]|uniref:tryptophan 2,3-dioxygenase-like n=1 Tax=Asterias amurensis TaxID=7602 RepID=UPI003AB6B675
MSCPFMQGQRAAAKTIGDAEDDDPAMHYHKYLHLEKVLGSQHLQSEKEGSKVHDEHLFIVVHQVYELWFKQMLYEIDSVRSLLSEVPFDERKQLVINQRMGRVVGIAKIQVEQIHILETMTPMDFLEFRTFLAPASGFESQQFRILENRLGLKPEWRVKYAQKNYKHAHQGEQLEGILQAEEEPSLLSIVEKWLERTPGLDSDCFNFWKKFQDAAQAMIDDIRRSAEGSESDEEKAAIMQEYELAQQTFQTVFDVDTHNMLVSRGDRRFSHKALQGALFISLYRDQCRFSQPFQFLTLLMDLDSLIMRWRLNHVQLVQRMIGSRPGTGGSSGYMYLKATSSDRYKVFVDLFNLSTFLLPRKYIPALSNDMKRKLSIPFGKAFVNSGNIQGQIPDVVHEGVDRTDEVLETLSRTKLTDSPKV